MKFLKVEATNFGSYKNIVFDFENQGLTLIHGATGSGKSTLQDLVPWILFGQTAKDGNADDIRRWESDAPTTGEVCLQIHEKTYTIRRVRGKPSECDLYFYGGSGADQRRGKDAAETQRLIEQTLGITPDVYHIAAYYNEYSPTRNFFDSNAKQRRELFETLADLSLPTKLTERIAFVKKDTKKELIKRTEEFNQAIGRVEAISRSKSDTERNAERWREETTRALEELKARSQGFEKEKTSKISALETKSQAFEAAKQKELETIENHLVKLAEQLNDATPHCDKCGSLNSHTQLKQRRFDEFSLKLDNVTAKTNPFLDQIQQAKENQNHYTQQLEAETAKVNPFLVQIASIESNIVKLKNKIISDKDQIDKVNHKIHSLDQLRDLVSKLRAELLRQAVKHVENETNRYLETYFDAEIRVQLDLGDSDNLEVLLWKSGYTCNYRQLSKGQKGLLKLCFSVSVMAASANKAGIHFSTLMFDEALDGLDGELKLKAYNLFDELAKRHETVLVIDHDQSLQSLFFNSYCVTLNGDESTIQDR